MSENHMMMEDVIGSHSERMKNLSKYYPFFKLWDNSLSLYKDGIYAEVDMPYMTLSIIRYFIEENQFNRKKVTYEMVCGFIRELLEEDFHIYDSDEKKALASFIFDKLCNDGRPFVFSWFDPKDKKKKVFRVRLIESRYANGHMTFELTEEAIAFYLDTKEIKDESRISVENVLLSKMVASRNFKGGLSVLMRINQEVMRLEAKKDGIINLLGHNVFEGVKALSEFMSVGLAWFDEEERLFSENKVLVDKAMALAKGTEAAKAVYDLDTALKMTMKKHSDLLGSCMALQVRADEMVRRAKHSRFRASVDFKDYLDKMTETDNLLALERFVKPLFMPKLHKTFTLTQLDELLDYKPEENVLRETTETGQAVDYVYEDEAAEARIQNNFEYFLKVLFEQIKEKGRVTLSGLNYLYAMKFGSEIYFNGDYYAFLAHLSQKSAYDLSKVREVQDTFLEGIMAKLLETEYGRPFEGLNFTLSYVPEKRIELPNMFDMTEIVFERTGGGWKTEI